jgi:hypothetical protein
MARDVLNQLAAHEAMTWHVEQGRFHMLAYSAYKPGEAVVLRPDTGLIGVPQQTIDGIQATCLLNPAIGPGTRVQIDRQLISQYRREGQSVSLNPRTPTFAAPVSNSGFYKVLLVNYVGDTRGNGLRPRLDRLGKRLPLSSARRCPDRWIKRHTDKAGVPLELCTGVAHVSFPMKVLIASSGSGRGSPSTS